MDKVLCPWCGAIMTLCVDAYSDGTITGAYYECIDCKSNSPYIEDADDIKAAARAAAMRRYVEPNRVLAADEVTSGEIVAAWEENRRYPIDLGGWTLCSNEEPVMEHYGKTWRAWLRRPTDEERKAVRWEDD